MKLKLLGIAVAVLSVASCWGPERSAEGTAQISSDVEDELVFPCDNADGSVVCDTVQIYSNRSWSASVTSGEDWLEISVKEHLNLEEYMQTVLVEVKATDNKGAERSGDVCIMTDGLTYPFKVVQSGLVPRISVENPNHEVSSDAGVYPLTVKSNVHWTAELSSESTADAGIDVTSADGNAVVNLTLKENEDSESVKLAKVVFNADGCEPVVAELVQEKGVPYLRFEDGADGVFTARPAYFGYELKFKTNVSWTAELISSDGFESAALEKNEGTKEDSSLKLNFPPATCIGKTAVAQLRFVPDGAEAVTVEVRQEPAIGAVIMDSSTGTLVAAEDWPFSYPLMADVPATKTGNASDPFFQQLNNLVLVSGHKIGLCSSAGLWCTATTGLNAGGSPAGSYFVSPAVPDHRLVKVYFRSASKTPKRLDFSVCEADRVTVVKGGDQVSLSASKVDNTWVLGGTENGVSYYFVNASTGNFCMGEIVFYYE